VGRFEGKWLRGVKAEWFSIFKKTFKPEFEFKHSKTCYSMYATVNSYISLIN
jgi:hypothetical protein